MPDVSEQLRDWSRSLAVSVASTDIADVVSSNRAGNEARVERRWVAVAAAVAFVVAGIVAVASFAGGGEDRIGPVTEVPATTDQTAPSSTTPDPPSTPAPTPTSEPSSSAPTPNEAEFDVAAAFGDVEPGALAVTSDGRVVAAAGARLLVRNPDGGVVTIDLADGITVEQAQVGTDDIAVAWGADRGVEVDLRTGDFVTDLTRSGDTWTRSDPSSAVAYAIKNGRPNNALGLDLLVDADTQLPDLEGAGGFEVLTNPAQQWTIPRPAEGSALINEIAPLADGEYLVTMRSISADPADSSDAYPYVLRADGSVEPLDPIDTSERIVDAQPGPNGLTVLHTDATTATIEQITIPNQ